MCTKLGCFVKTICWHHFSTRQRQYHSSARETSVELLHHNGCVPPTGTPNEGVLRYEIRNRGLDLA